MSESVLEDIKVEERDPYTGEVIPANETPLQKKIRENRHLTDAQVSRIEGRKDASIAAEKTSKENAEKEVGDVGFGATRVFREVNPADLKPSPFRNATEDVVANAEDEVGRFERRNDEGVGK